MTEVEDFLASTTPRQAEAESALYNGDPQPRMDMWSKRDPVTLFGASHSRVGWDDVSQAFRAVASRYSHCTSYQFDVLAADVSGDLAYAVGCERTTASINGVPRTFTLRVTHLYRRDNGQWKLVHRHGVPPPDDAGPCGQANTVNAPGRTRAVTGSEPSSSPSP